MNYTNRSNLNSDNRVFALSEFSKLFTYQQIYLAYFDCRKNKRWKEESIEFEIDYVDALKDLLNDINSKRYKIGPSVCFLVYDPKVREIFAALFRDRIVHHLVINELEPLFEDYFIDSCYSCRKGKGTLYGQLDVFKKIKNYTLNYTTKYGIITKLDCDSYFTSINRELLYNKLEKFVLERYFKPTKELLLWLIKEIVYYSPIEHCVFKTPKDKWKLLPPHKSLFFIPEGFGLPIGNLTSQWFGNFFLSEYDFWASSQYSYGRYVDDNISLEPDFYYAKKFRKESLEFLIENCQISLNNNKIYMLYYPKGVKFIGAVLKNGRGYLTNRIIGNFYNLLYNFKYTDKEFSALHSYIGTIKNYNEYKKYSEVEKTFELKTILEYEKNKQYLRCG